MAKLYAKKNPAKPYSKFKNKLTSKKKTNTNTSSGIPGQSNTTFSSITCLIG